MTDSIFTSEQAVETMSANGRKIMDEAIALYSPTVILAAYSGGDDSIVSTHFAVENFGCAVVHCDTRIGMKATRRHLDAVSDYRGWDLRVFQGPTYGPPKNLNTSLLPAGEWTDGATAYEELIFNWGFPGPAQHHRCYGRLKERALRLAARSVLTKRGQRVLLVSGIRADESAIRAGYKRSIQLQKGSQFVWANPFYHHTESDFEAYRQEFGLPRNPVKPQIGISGECLCGAFASPGELAAVRTCEPETGAYLDSLRGRVAANGFPWSWGERCPEWWVESRRGQGLLEFEGGTAFQPMCVGCPRRGGANA